MRKILLLIVAVLLISGCASSMPITEEELRSILDNVNSEQEVQRVEVEKVTVNCDWDMYEALLDQELVPNMMGLFEAFHFIETFGYGVENMVAVDVDSGTREWYYNSSPENTLIFTSDPKRYTVKMYYYNKDNDKVTVENKKQLASVFGGQLLATYGMFKMTQEENNGRITYVYDDGYQFSFDISEDGLMSAMCRTPA